MLVLSILLLLISKEIFSYDSEKVVILCILTFLMLVFFNSKEVLFNVFFSQTLQLNKKYSDFLNLIKELEVAVKSKIKIFVKTKKQCKRFMILFIFKSFFERKFNFNRKILSLSLVKDQLNKITKNVSNIEKNLNLFFIKNNLSNLYFFLFKKTNLKLFLLNLLKLSLNKLIKANLTNSFFYLFLFSQKREIKYFFKV